MKAIPRLIAGTAVVLAAVLTTAPVTAGIADFVLSPGQQPTKRAALALTGSRTPPVGPIGTREKERNHDDPSRSETDPDEGISSAPTTPTASAPATVHSAAASDQGVVDESAGLVAHTAADARARVSDLAGDLQAGVKAGEFSQADADRVLSDLSGYIRGERTWPERTVA